ncbi:hypothetical protein [Lysinibacillus capsici]|uniref:hypothetical protein n=1 Tax=Lysinibacillus capsici TaxID=2115968 RepID=UPI000E209CDF|nr:hypothetical protein [Lysinibacillus capsici]RDV27779.1 hypothetical protein C7B89_19570 [Lysinibacillus capsici]
MADIIKEIDTIGDLLATVDVTRLYKQDLPLKYIANTLGIRWQGDSDDDFTQAAYEINRIYQIIYFGNSEIDCLKKSKLIRSKLSDYLSKKVQIRDSNDFITFESFSMSAPFKTETDGVYAVVGVLNALLLEAYTQPQYEKMREIHAAINEGGI